MDTITLISVSQIDKHSTTKSVARTIIDQYNCYEKCGKFWENLRALLIHHFPLLEAKQNCVSAKVK